MKRNTHIEIMSPAGSYAALSAAIRAGAGSIYFGVGALNMRSRAADSFDLTDMRKIARICKWCGVRSYLALNTVIYGEDLSSMQELCVAAKENAISAVIATDMSTILQARELGLEVHLSVQTNISNIKAVKFYAQYADTMVLARELTLEQITDICDEIKGQNIRGPSGRLVQIELFAHGALCVAIAGKCYMSLGTYNSSANRGACLQNCRRKYRIIDEETGDELVLENKHVMSPKDLCTIEHLDKLIKTGANILKIEGRGRTPDYVGTVTRVYHEALEAIEGGAYHESKFSGWKNQLEEVYNRGFWEGGYYCGEKMGEWSGAGHSQATIRRVQIGVIKNYYSNIGIAEFQLKQPALNMGDDLLIEGPTTGALRLTLKQLRVGGMTAQQAKKGDMVTIEVPQRVRRQDKVFIQERQDSSSQDMIEPVV